MITGIYVQEETTTICFGLWASAWLVLVKLLRGVHPLTFQITIMVSLSFLGSYCPLMCDLLPLCREVCFCFVLFLFSYVPYLCFSCI